MLNIGRTSMGAFIRSPMGVLTRRRERIIYPTSCFSRQGILTAGPGTGATSFTTEPASDPFTVDPQRIVIGFFHTIDSFTGSEYDVRSRAGFTFDLAPSYVYFKRFYFVSKFVAIPFQAHSPTIVLSAIDQSGNYGNISPKASFDWENDIGTILDTNVGTALTSYKTEIPYATMEPFFGDKVSFVVCDNNDLNSIPNKGFVLDNHSDATNYPYLSIE